MQTAPNVNVLNGATHRYAKDIDDALFWSRRPACFTYLTFYPIRLLSSAAHAGRARETHLETAAMTPRTKAQTMIDSVRESLLNGLNSIFSDSGETPNPGDVDDIPVNIVRECRIPDERRERFMLSNGIMFWVTRLSNLFYIQTFRFFPVTLWISNR